MEKLNINTNGNKKLRNGEDVRFIIWNLPAVKTCPFRTVACEKSCYARKAERVYPQVLPAREKNLEASKSPDFVENMIYTIEKELSRRVYTGKTVVFRIHESGDFYGVEYSKKWVAIAKHFEDDTRIIFLAYTKSLPYIIAAGYGLPTFPKNLIIRSSIWADTSREMIIKTCVLNIPIYTALTAEDMERERADGRVFVECRCDDCGTCGKCWKKDDQEIICKIH